MTDDEKKYGVLEWNSSFSSPLIMLGEGGVEWRPEEQAVVALPPLNMNLARYLIIPAIKSKKIRGRSALRPLDIAGLSQFL